jgi:hypothetical protein
MKKLAFCVLIAGIALALLAPVSTNDRSASAQEPPDVYVLLWETRPKDDGQLLAVYPFEEDQEIEMLVDFPPGVFDNVAKTCGQDYWAAGGQGAAIFTGSAEGSIAIYPMTPDGTIIPLGDEVHRMACTGPKTFQFSPNGQHVGYIDYVYGVIDQEFPYGDLRLYDATTGDQLGTFDWTTAFELYDDGALMFRLFPDGKGNATEADVDWWTESGRQTLVTLEPVYPEDKPDIECGITAGAVARMGDTAYILTGQKCETGSSNWRLVSVPMAGGQATEIAFETPGGGFFPGNFAIDLYPTRDGLGFLVGVPSGMARNTMSLLWVPLDGRIRPVLEGYHVKGDRFGNRLTEGRNMVLSPNGQGLAFVTVTGNQQETLWLLDLSTPGNEPVKLEEEGANQRIFHYVWAVNNTLYYAAGGIESNSLHMVTLGSSPSRVSRGRFFQLAVSYAGDKIAAAEWYANPNSIGDDLFKLSVLDMSGSSTTLLEGGDDYNELRPLAIK